MIDSFGKSFMVKFTEHIKTRAADASQIKCRSCCNAFRCQSIDDIVH